MFRDFIHFFRAAFQFSRSLRSIPEADSPEFWTEDDAKFLSNFLQSYTGKKLVLRLGHYAYKSALAAVRQKGVEAYECGEAAGIQKALTALQAHQISQVPAHRDETEIEQSGDMLSDLEAQMS